MFYFESKRNLFAPSERRLSASPDSASHRDGIRRVDHDTGVTEVIIDRPPVNALHVAGWFALARTLTEAGRDPHVRCVAVSYTHLTLPTICSV